MRDVAAGWRRQWDIVVAEPDYAMTLATNPLLAVVFLAIVQSAGRDDLLGHAVLAPALLAMWAMSLFVSGEVVATDREVGLLELSLASPSSYPLVTLGRVALVTALALLAFAESWLVALVVFGVAIPVAHPAAFALAITTSALSMTGTALAMSALFVRTTSVRRYQNALSYPFYVLGGIMVPVALLPDWIEPASRLVFLSWSSDLLRDSLATQPVDDLAARLSAILALGLAGALAGAWLTRRMIDRLRRTGETALT